MSPSRIASATKPSLARDWLYALRYWLRGRRGLAVLVFSAVVIGGALNWSWLVAVGIAPLLIAVLPCAAMCALGVCMHKIGQRSCSTETRSVEPPQPDARVVASVESAEPGSAPRLADKAPAAGPVISLPEPAKSQEKELT